MNREEKAAVIEEVASQIRDAQAIFAVDYRGLTVKQASDLRARLIEIDANLRVVKNTLTERAADEVGAESLKQYLNGPTAFTFVNGDPVLAAKALAAFRRETQLPEFKGGLMDGKELSIEDIEGLSRLPSLDVMHGQLVGMIASPLSGLVRSMNAILSGIAIALGQVQEQGLLAGNPDPAAAADAAPAEAAADAAPAAAASDAAADAPANGGDEGAQSEAASPADDAAATAEADAPAADESSPAEAVGAEDTPSAPADAPDPAAAEEIPNQPMPAPEAAGDGDATETSNEEGDN